MDRRERELRLEVKRAGLQLVSLGYTGSTHYKLRLRGPFGEASTVCSLSSSDQRAVHKVRQLFRQIADGRYEGLRP